VNITFGKPGKPAAFQRTATGPRPFEEVLHEIDPQQAMPGIGPGTG